MNDGPDTVRLRTLALVAQLKRLDPQSPVLRRLGLSIEADGPRVARSPRWFWSWFVGTVVVWTVILVVAA